MKVFEVIHYSCFDLIPTINTRICLSKERAISIWESMVKEATEDVEESLEDGERTIERDDKKLYFNAYQNGRASELEYEIYVVEKEVIE